MMSTIKDKSVSVREYIRGIIANEDVYQRELEFAGENTHGSMKQEGDSLEEGE